MLSKLLLITDECTCIAQAKVQPEKPRDWLYHSWNATDAARPQFQIPFWQLTEAIILNATIDLDGPVMCRVIICSKWLYLVLELLRTQYVPWKVKENDVHAHDKVKRSAWMFLTNSIVCHTLVRTNTLNGWNMRMITLTFPSRQQLTIACWQKHCWQGPLDFMTAADITVIPILYICIFRLFLA